jgi:hypothetical protein
MTQSLCDSATALTSMVRAASFVATFDTEGARDILA